VHDRTELAKQGCGGVQFHKPIARVACVAIIWRLVSGVLLPDASPLGTTAREASHQKVTTNASCRIPLLVIMLLEPL
jgi:hypothetical protein